MKGDPLAVLSRIRETRARPVVVPGERCELCTEPIGAEHGHLVDLEGRNLLCACRGCWLLFTPEGAGGGHFRAVPDRYLEFSEFTVSPATWDALQIPVGIAFFFMNSSLGRVAAFYPGPAGATESQLPLDAWDDMLESNPALASVEPDVEAILVRSERHGAGATCFLVPIDACYELVGHLRRLWKGFDGGAEANQALDDFFDKVAERAR